AKDKSLNFAEKGERFITRIGSSSPVPAFQFQLISSSSSEGVGWNYCRVLPGDHFLEGAIK
ncbi:unnamed protein product, partial [Allacma fusca]